MIRKFLHNKFLQTKMLVISNAISKLPFQKGCGPSRATNTPSNAPFSYLRLRSAFLPPPLWVSCLSHVTCFCGTDVLTKGMNFIHDHCKCCWNLFVYILCLLLRCKFIEEISVLLECFSFVSAYWLDSTSETGETNGYTVKYSNPKIQIRTTSEVPNLWGADMSQANIPHVMGCSQNIGRLKRVLG